MTSRTITCRPSGPITEPSAFGTENGKVQPPFTKLEDALEYVNKCITYAPQLKVWLADELKNSSNMVLIGPRRSCLTSSLLHIPIIFCFATRPCNFTIFGNNRHHINYLLRELVKIVISWKIQFDCTKDVVMLAGGATVKFRVIQKNCFTRKKNTEEQIFLVDSPFCKIENSSHVFVQVGTVGNIPGAPSCL